MLVSLAEPLGEPTWTTERPLAGLEEHELWREAAETLGLPTSSATHIMEYAFKEMVNNAIEHSSGIRLRTRWWVRDRLLAFEVQDDGVGALAHLRDGLGLPDALSAIQELSKGKRTTDPERHTGQGIFFTSKAVDEFSLSANGWRWVVDNDIGDQTVEEVPSHSGTIVACSIDPATERDLGDVFSEFTRDLAFDVSRPSVKLLTYGTRLVSRSEAKLLLEGLERFREVEIDFAGVDSVGQGFIDQVFRVWASEHPETRLMPVNMNDAVRFMVERGLPDSPPRTG